MGSLSDNFTNTDKCEIIKQISKKPSYIYYLSPGQVLDAFRGKVRIYQHKSKRVLIYLQPSLKAGQKIEERFPVMSQAEDRAVNRMFVTFINCV